MNIFNYNATLRYHSIIEELLERKQLAFRRIHNNIAQKNNAIIDVQAHEHIGEMTALLREAALLADINAETHQWMHQQITELTRLDFSLDNPKTLATEKEIQVGQICSFLKNKY